MTDMFEGAEALSDANKCFIHGSFQSNDAWPYDWSDLCESAGYTYVPDDNFEQALIDLGYDDTLENYVVTDSISGVTELDVRNDSISDLTGIEDFIALTNLLIDGNQLTSLDISSNTALMYLGCSENQLTSLDVSNNTQLFQIICSINQLTSLDVSNNTSLAYLTCHSNQLTSIDLSNNTALTAFWGNGNQLTSLDLSNNTALTGLDCGGNQLTYLNMKNGVTDALTTFNATNNDSLECIETLDPDYATTNWTYENGNIDEGVFFAIQCVISNLHVATTGSDSTGDGTYENPFATIQKGIDAANSGDTVSVAAGTYVENINYSGKNISVIGEDRETTIIDGNQNGSVVTFENGEDSTTVLSGFTITNGEGDQWIGGGINIYNSDPLLNSLIITNNNGGGILSSESTVEIDSVDFAYNSSSNNGAAINSIESTVKVQNSTFSLNTSDNIGGAIYVDPLTTCEIYNSSFYNNEALWGGAIATVGGGKLLVEGCNISFNTASGNNPNPNQNYPTFGGGGGIYQEWSDSLEIYDSEITNNTAATGAGGGIAVYLSNDVTINNIVLSDNSSSGPNYPSGGGGAAFYRADNVLFENSTIANNVSNHNSGGGIFLGSESGQASIVVYATFNRLTLVNNSALSGGAIFCWSAILNLYHSTLAQNEASNSEWSGGGLASHYVSRPNIRSSLFYNNLPNSIHNGYPQTPVFVAYSLVQEQWAGGGNLIDIDPLFCDPDSGDYSLAENSPCVGTGEDGSNMGAFGVGCEAILSTDKDVIPLQYILHQNYPNPFNPVTTLRYELPENAMINITIYDMLGREVKTLINQTQDAGYRSVIWDATNDYGKPVSAGIYLYQIQAGEYIQTKKMVLLK